MKIDKSRVYTADIYVVTKLIPSMQDTPNCEDERTNKKVIMIKFGKSLVPIWYVQSPLQFLDVSSRVNKNGLYKEDNRFLRTTPNGIVGERFVKDVKPLFANPEGKIALEELVKQQKIHAKHDNEYAPTI